MYSPAVGALFSACSTADIYHQFFQIYLRESLRTGRNHMAIQYTFIVTTKPASSANQFNCTISLGATNNMATVKTIFIISHTKKPTKAEPALAAFCCRASPRIKNAAGTTTANAPYPADQPANELPVRPQAAKATRHPTKICQTSTLQGDNTALAFNKMRASSALRGLNSGSSCPCSSSAPSL